MCAAGHMAPSAWKVLSHQPSLGHPVFATTNPSVSIGYKCFSVTKPFLINLRQTGYSLSYLQSWSAVSTPTVMGLITDWLLERHLQVIFPCKTVRSSSVGNHDFSLRMLLFVRILILLHSAMPGWERDLVVTFIELVNLLP